MPMFMLCNCLAPCGGAARRWHRVPVLGLLSLAAAGGALAQDAPAQGTPAFLMSPSATISEMVTNNTGLTAQNPRSDAVTRGTLGIDLRRRSGRSTAQMNYSLSALAYARQSESNTIQQALDASLDMEWWERQGFLQATASISQGAVSAFGAQPTASSLPNANFTEVRRVQIAPRWEGPLGRDLKFSAQAQFSATNAEDNTAGDSTSSSVQLQVAPNQSGPVGWFVQASHQSGDFRSSTASGSTRVFGSVSRAFVALDLRASVNAGFERGDVISSSQQTAGTWGVGLDWAPSPRTSANLQFDRRLFGDSHSVSLQHRTPLTVWRISSSRSLNQSGSGFVPGAVWTVYDLYFSQFASVEPDPIRRADLVNAFLMQNGLSPTTPLSNGFLRAATTIDNRQEISAAWHGVRSTATVTYGRNRSRRANPDQFAADDLAASDTVRTSTWSLAATHRLTPELSTSASASFQSGDGELLGQSNRQRVFSAQIGGRLSPKSSWSVILRRALYETQRVPYGESAAIASYTLRF